MEATDTFSLDVAKTSFLSLLSSTDPSEVGNFMDWVIKHCSSVNSDDGTKESANQCDETLLMPGDKRMKKIIKDIKKRIPLDGIMSSENIYHPEGKVMLEYSGQFKLLKAPGDRYLGRDWVASQLEVEGDVLL